MSNPVTPDSSGREGRALGLHERRLSTNDEPGSSVSASERLRAELADSVTRAVHNALLDLWERAQGESNEGLERACKDVLTALGLSWVRPRTTSTDPSVSLGDAGALTNVLGLTTEELKALLLGAILVERAGEGVFEGAYKEHAISLRPRLRAALDAQVIANFDERQAQWER